MFQDLEGRKGVGDKSRRAGRWEGPGVEIQKGKELVDSTFRNPFPDQSSFQQPGIVSATRKALKGKLQLSVKPNHKIKQKLPSERCPYLGDL